MTKQKKFITCDGNQVFDITLISAQVKVEDKLIAECRMKIFIKKE